MNWGNRLTLVILVFMAIMAVMVVYSFRQDLNMVTDNYYEKDLKYQEQMDKIQNTKMLIEKPRVQYRSADKILTVQFPENLLHHPISGEIHLFRPSDYKMDKSYKIELDDRGVQFINTAELLIGEWTVKLSWNDGHQSYYDEIEVFIR